ncbi:MAG: phosphate signaling complex protein PhoU [Alphaproteobacteria bacterium]
MSADITSSGPFDNLTAIRDLVARMGGLTEQQLSGAADALGRRDSKMAEQIILADDAIDDMERQIEQQMIVIAATDGAGQAEWVGGLALIRIASDLERVGDLAKNLAKRTLVLNQSPQQRSTQGLIRMIHAVQAQLGDVLDAFSALDAAKARSVWQADGTIDELNNGLFQEITSMMMAQPHMTAVGTHLLFMAKNVERIGDHCTNIAEIVFAIVEGAPLEDDRPKADRTSLTMVQPSLAAQS